MRKPIWRLYIEAEWVVLSWPRVQVVDNMGHKLFSKSRVYLPKGHQVNQAIRQVKAALQFAIKQTNILKGKRCSKVIHK